MRLFVGLPLEETDAAELDNRFPESLVPRELWRRVPARNYHCTLQFLGEIDAADSERYADHLDAVASEPEFRDAARAMQADPVSPVAITAFPAPSRPRVLILTLTDPEGALAALSRTVGKVLAPLGFRPESRPFKPHITIGYTRNRVTDPVAAGSLAQISSGVSLPDRLVFPVLRLVHSTLGPGGARYQSLRDYALEAEPGKAR